MAAIITDQEWQMLEAIPEGMLVDLAADLDICPPERIDHRALFEQCVVAIVARGRQESLPFSKYDREDLEALPPPHITAIGRLQQIQGQVTVDDVLRVGARVYKFYQRNRPDNPLALMLPSLLTAVARQAAESV
ncbi:MAG: hypothetical protein HN348_01995 [Proteobacteria bacterium]|nr:hypothetical protein [Pseudomonadota bacterium]